MSVACVLEQGAAGRAARATAHGSSAQFKPSQARPGQGEAPPSYRAATETRPPTASGPATLVRYGGWAGYRVYGGGQRCQARIITLAPLACRGASVLKVEPARGRYVPLPPHGAASSSRPHMGACGRARQWETGSGGVNPRWFVLFLYEDGCLVDSWGCRWCAGVRRCAQAVTTSPRRPCCSCRG